MAGRTKVSHRLSSLSIIPTPTGPRLCNNRPECAANVIWSRTVPAKSPGFWCLRKPTAGARYAEWDHEAVRLETVICPVQAGHQRAGRRLTDLSVILPDAPLGDVLWTWQGDLLLHARAIEIITELHLTGLYFRAVKARVPSLSGAPVPHLREACPVGWGGVAPPESGVQLLESCSTCGLKTYSAPVDARRLINRSEWDGADFFMVWPLPRFLFLTERAASALRGLDRGGGRLVPVESLRFSGTLSPGRLSYWFPEQQARRIGMPIGIY